MKNLILYYSRDGNTQFVAEEIALNIKADVEEIKEKKNRKGLWGWITAAMDAGRENTAELVKLKSDIKKYDRIFIGQPVWAGKMNPAIRALAAQYEFDKKKVVLFCSMGGDKDDQCLSQTKAALGKAKILAAKAFRKPLKSVELAKENVRELIKSSS